ncbi:MAG TPA: hypothetical protein DCW68_06590 [Rhodospirillaceae bacterium]|nr:MAG: hypothetical protein A2018_01100 [Alphaproteobacteria bacterium GWF2_58_20]HAU29755.1 hypothetical protein [Rhodospirillaceae bacterium]
MIHLRMRFESDGENVHEDATRFFGVQAKNVILKDRAGIDMRAFNTYLHNIRLVMAVLCKKEAACSVKSPESWLEPITTV